MAETTTLDEEKLNEFIGRFAVDFGAALHATTVVIGDKLGIYRALAEGATDADGLAARTGTSARLVSEWLKAQYVSGYCEHDPAAGTWWLSPEQSAVLAVDGTPAFLVGAMTIAASTAKDEDRIRAAFLSGKGLGWHEQDPDLFEGTERLFKPGYLGNLVSAWLPALDGVEPRLRAGAKVADLGCGHGASTILLASSYPDSTVVGFDYHEASIEQARKRAADAGVGDRVRFEVASAEDFERIDGGWDLVCVFDALHDMGDPEWVAAHIASTLSDDGTLLLVEPMAGESLEENANPVGRVFYSASTVICTPAGQSQGDRALGAQVPDNTWRDILRAAGFTRFRRAAETPFNRVFEVRR
ncbi:class I SAM-dependent methyltransferase [soil metagenome]